MAVFSYIVVASKTKEELQEGVASLVELHLQIYFLQLHSPQKKIDLIFLKIWTTITVKETKSQTENIPNVYGSL